MLITPAPNQKLRQRLKKIAIGGLTLAALTAAGAGLASNLHQQEDRAAWLERATRGFKETRAYCEKRQVFGLETEMPPMVSFYLNHEGAFDHVHSSWEIEHDGARVMYQLSIQFDDFSDETLTRIASLDEKIDDGDLFSGEMQLTLCGFTTRLPGPVSSSEKFVSDFRAQPTVNPI